MKLQRCVTFFEDEAKYKVRDKRHGLRLRCRKCNYQVKIGGFKELRHINRILDEVRDGHECDAEWIIERDYHSAEIGHTFVAQTTNQTHTGDTDYTDISGAEIGSTNFAAGKKYLILITNWFRGTATNAKFAIRALHGSTAFAESEMIHEPFNNTRRNTYMWFTVWTAVSGEEIKLQHKTFNSANTIHSDQITLLAINLSDDLTEDLDWHFDENTTDTSVPVNDWTTDNNPTITFKPNRADKDWLVIESSRLDSVSTTSRTETRLRWLEEDVEKTTEPKIIQEAGDNNDAFIHTIPRVFRLNQNEHKFEAQSQKDGGSAGNRTNGVIFALNLNKFRNHAHAFTEAELAVSGAGVAYADETQTVDITPDVTGDVWALSFLIFDCPQPGRSLRHRLQVDNADSPATQTSDAYYVVVPTDNVEELCTSIQTVTNLDATSHTFDTDANASTTPSDVEDRTIIAVTMELAEPEGAGSNVVGTDMPKTTQKGISVFDQDPSLLPRKKPKRRIQLGERLHHINNAKTNGQLKIEFKAKSLSKILFRQKFEARAVVTPIRIRTGISMSKLVFSEKNRSQADLTLRYFTKNRAVGTIKQGYYSGDSYARSTLRTLTANMEKLVKLHQITQIFSLYEKMDKMTPSINIRSFEFDEPMDEHWQKVTKEQRFKAFTHSSSFVGNVRYDAEEQSMRILLNGVPYSFCGVPERVFDAFQGADSKGAFFARNIKGQFNC